MVWVAPSGIGKWDICVWDVLKIINFTNCCVLLSFNKCTHKLTFSVSLVCQATLSLHVLEIRCTCTFKQFVHHTRKINKVTCFSFHVYVFHHTILNLTIVSKINLWWSFIPFFSYPNPIANNLSWNDLWWKAKIKTLQCSVWNPFIFWNSKKLTLTFTLTYLKI